MNIIIPLGGLGKRFKDDDYLLPKPLIKIYGKSMIFHLIDSLKYSEEDEIYIIYNKELNKYQFNQLFKKYKKIFLIELNKQTIGASETVLYGLQFIKNLNKKTIVLDCDNFYNINIIKIFREQEKYNTIFCFFDDNNNPIYSYIIFNKNNIIEKIKEKEKISNYANCGCYCFENGIILKTYIEKLLKEKFFETNEFYISCVISQMINDGNLFIANIINKNDFICVGTPLQLKIYCQNINNINEKKRFCFDLDNTLVSSPEIENDYTTVKPIIKNIEMLKFLKNTGNYIIIYTARKMRSNNNNVGKIIKDVGQITFDTLKNFKIPYDELHFGKPYADFYIDDLAINSNDDLEKNLGYYLTDISERSFNEIKTENFPIIVKKSLNNKIKGEINFYLNIPHEIKKFFPIFINYGENWYSIEKINGITLSYLYINESLTEDILTKFLDVINKIHNVNIINNDDIDIYQNYIDKLISRYQNYNYSKFINSEDIYKKLLDYFYNYQDKNFGIKKIIHGDPVFTNCFLNNYNEFKLIDMRGMINNYITLYGDIFYDYGKIYQSLIGYDEILFDKNISNNYKDKMIKIFFNYIEINYGEKYINIIKMITKSLLFTLLPLHDNEKCFKYYNLINNF